MLSTTELKSKPWNIINFALPQDILSVTGMLSYQEKRMLYYLALHYYSGKGAILDMGSYLGGSTICFATALKQRGIQEPVIHSYDFFKLAKFELELHFKGNPPPNLKTREIFDDNLKNYQNLLYVYEGNVLDFSWTGLPIEILFVDIAKSYKVFDYIIMNLFPSLIPSHSLVILQDYIWKTTGPWHHVVMEKLSDYFEYVVDTDINSVVFLFKKNIPKDMLVQCLWNNIPTSEKLELMDTAIDKLDGESKKEHLKASRELLVQGKDMKWGMNYE